MAVQLNHTIVWCRDKQSSATFLTEVLGLPPPQPFGPSLVVELSNGVSLDFYETDGEIASQHYAFLIDEDDFDRFISAPGARGSILGRPRPAAGRQINRNDGGRGFYFEDPDGHLLEVLTRPYGSGE